MAPQQEQKEQSIATLASIIGLLGFAAEISANDSDGRLALVIKADDPGRLIGRKGHYLQSMELVLNRILRKKLGQFPWVEVEVNGYQKKTRAHNSLPEADAARLQQTALDAAKEVKRWGKPKRIGPFSARERRVIHLVLRDDEEVDTESESGDHRGTKRVIIRAAETRPS